MERTETMRARDIMTTNAVTINPDADIVSIAQLLIDKNISDVRGGCAWSRHRNRTLRIS